MTDINQITSFCGFDWSALQIDLALFQNSFSTFVSEVNNVQILDPNAQAYCNVFAGWFQWMNFVVSTPIDCLNPRSTFCFATFNPDGSPNQTEDWDQPWCTAFFCVENLGAPCAYWYNQQQGMAGQGVCYEVTGCAINCLRVADNTQALWSGQLSGDISALLGNYLGAMVKRKGERVRERKRMKRKRSDLTRRLKRYVRNAKKSGGLRKRFSTDTPCSSCGCDWTTNSCEDLCMVSADSDGQPCWDGDFCCTCLVVN